METGINFTITSEDDIKILEQLLSEHGKGEQKPVVGFLIEEFRNFDYNKIAIEVELFGDFDFNIIFDNEYIIWISVSEDQQTLSVYSVEYNWYNYFSNYKLQEIIFPFYKDVFAGNYEIESVRDGAGGFISSSLTYKSETKTDQAMFSKFLSPKSTRITNNFYGTNLYKTKS